MYVEGVCGPKREEVTGLRKPLNEELHAFYCSQNIIRIATSVMLRWAGHVASMTKACKTLVGKQRKKDNFRDVGVDGSSVGGCGTEWI
jgi:hypothetical protein